MIVLPMAGLSSRFTRAGYDQPKYMLPLNGKTVFDYSVSSFQDVFKTHPFLFIARHHDNLNAFLSERLEEIGIVDFQVVILNDPTRGQAETVAMGVQKASVPEDCPLTIFNIDTFRSGPFIPFEERYPEADGILEVFRGEGDNWSFAEPDDREPNLVKRTTEKIPISDLCSDGLYHFATKSSFIRAYEAELKTPQAPELYIAPLYNNLINQGGKVYFDEVPYENLFFSGVPSEYEALLKVEHSLPDLAAL